MGGRSGRHRVLGGLNTLIGGVVVGASALEVMGSWGARPAIVIVAALAAVASAFLMVSGAGLWAGRPFGRRAALQGAASLIPIHLTALLIAHPGIPAVLLGIVYPAIVVAVLGRGNRDGAVETPEAGKAPSPIDPKRHLRVVSVA